MFEQSASCKVGVKQVCLAKFSHKSCKRYMVNMWLVTFSLIAGLVFGNPEGLLNGGATFSFAYHQFIKLWLLACAISS